MTQIFRWPKKRLDFYKNSSRIKPEFHPYSSKRQGSLLDLPHQKQEARQKSIVHNIYSDVQELSFLSAFAQGAWDRVCLDSQSTGIESKD